MKKIPPLLLNAFIFLGLLPHCLSATSITFSIDTAPTQVLEAIGQQIYRNETGGNEAYLISWNEGESFASLGIGHFIWYPANQGGIYTEQFPLLVAFLEEHKASLPAWLSPNTPCPWANKEIFIQQSQSVQMQDLRLLLRQTMALQVKFIIHRLQKSIPTLQAYAESDAQKDHITRQLERLMQTPQGLYALADYTNFKGDGTSPTERYNGHGWGLLQVLCQMDPNDLQTSHAFAEAATQVLTWRVLNAPASRKQQETKWLIGWKNRVNTYVSFSPPLSVDDKNKK